jgi:hypothetical protein
MACIIILDSRRSRVICEPPHRKFVDLLIRAVLLEVKLSCISICETNIASWYVRPQALLRISSLLGKCELLILCSLVAFVLNYVAWLNETKSRLRLCCSSSYLSCRLVIHIISVVCLIHHIVVSSAIHIRGVGCSVISVEQVLMQACRDCCILLLLWVPALTWTLWLDDLC